MEFVDDIPKYRKKSQKKPPKKANHRHLYEPCIIEIPADWFNKPHGRCGKKTPYFYSYCPICGKVGNKNPCWERWWVREKRFNGAIHYYEIVPTAEGAKQLNPWTRTLPTFHCEDIFPKFVDLEKQ